MGTFHSHKGELHGITVVVRTAGPRVYVGRCDEQRREGILLLAADHHDDGEGGRTTREYLERAYRFGVYARHARVLVPAAEIAEVLPLGRLGATGPA